MQRNRARTVLVGSYGYSPTLDRKLQLGITYEVFFRLGRPPTPIASRVIWSTLQEEYPKETAVFRCGLPWSA
jgi:hypothetical protein